MNSLLIVDLSHNDINDITPLKNLTNLQELNINNCSIKDFTPLYELKKLQTLICNNLKKEDEDALKIHLPNLTIISSSYIIEDYERF